MEKTKYRCPYIKDIAELCEMSVPCRDCSQFSPDYLEKILTTTNNRSDEIAWLEKVASYPKSIGENFHVGIILKRLEQLRTVR